MQVKELITFYINETSKTLDVSFRMEIDGDDEIRNDSIILQEVDNFGYEFLNEETELFDEDLDENFGDYSDDFFIDESEILSFLNEYYMVNENKIPPTELF